MVGFGVGVLEQSGYDGQKIIFETDQVYEVNDAKICKKERKSKLLYKQKVKYIYKNELGSNVEAIPLKQDGSEQGKRKFNIPQNSDMTKMDFMGIAMKWTGLPNLNLVHQNLKLKISVFRFQ